MMAAVFFLCIKGILVPCKLINSGKKNTEAKIKISVWYFTGETENKNNI